jgi:two-component system chemotaxis response regulator CheB
MFPGIMKWHNVLIPFEVVINFLLMKKKKTIQLSEQISELKNSLPVIVIGGSAGGFKALLDFAQALPRDLSAAIFVVLHVAPESNIAFIVQHVQQRTHYKCRIATRGESVKSGRIYFAVPGMHLMISKNRIVYGNGPEENNFKPSIDVLFRSAAVNFREQVTGIILSGLLDDGVAGMSAVQKCGGVCIVQDPVEAEFPQLPAAVLHNLEPDYTLAVGEMPNVLVKIAKDKPALVTVVPEEISRESSIAEYMMTDIDETRKLGTQSLFTCPDCGGTLFHIHDDKINRYRCFTGHAYSEHTLLKEQNENIQASLWVSLRLMEERKKLLSQINTNGSESVMIKKRDLEVHIEMMKKLISDLQRLTLKQNNGTLAEKTVAS